jgi:hypothetical protein
MQRCIIGPHIFTDFCVLCHLIAVLLQFEQLLGLLLLLPLHLV